MFLRYFDPSDETRKLQEEHWRPVLGKLENRLQLTIPVTDTLLPLNDAPDTCEKISSLLESCDAFSLSGTISCMNLEFFYNFTGMEALTRSLKSCLLPLALKYNLVSVDDAVQAALLEFSAQEQKWGTIPESHSIHSQATKRVASLATLLLENNIVAN